MREFNGSLNHPARVPLAAELHSRPFLRLDASEAITHLAICHSAHGAPLQAAFQHASWCHCAGISGSRRRSRAAATFSTISAASR